MAGALKGITVEIGGDTTKLGKALSGVNSKTKSLQSELKGVNTLLKMDPKNVTLLTQKQDLLTKAIGSTKEKLDILKNAQEQAQSQFEKGEITEEQYRDLQREIVATEQKLNGLTDELKEFGSVGAQQIAQVGEKVKDVGGKVESFGKGFSVVSAGTGAILAGSVKAFTELDEGYDTIVTKTGATGDALEELNGVADKIFGDMPTDMNLVGIAVGEINTRFGYTGDKLEGLSRQFLKFSEINGVDLNNSIGTVDKILEQFNMDASEAGNVLDIVTLKAQQTGIGADTLMNSIQQNGAVFKDMGLGVNEAVVLLSQFEANGVNVETALKSLKKATVEYAKDGKSMKDGLEDSIKSIKNAKTETEALAEVEKLFGSKGANEMVKAIREGRISVEDLSSAMGDYSGVVSDTFDATLDPIDKAKVAMNNLKLAGSELGTVAQSVFAPMLTALVEKLKDLASWFGNLSPSMQKTIVVILSVTTALGPMIIGIGKLITAFGTIMTTVPKLVSAFNTLKASLLTNPWVLLAVAIGAVVGGVIAYANANNKATSETQKLYKEIDEFNKKSREQKKAYDDMVNARAESARGIEAEYGYYGNLVDELSNIVDENGKVKDGYKERAETITGILSKALGEEISLDQIVANGKQKVIDKINELLTVKRAEAQLSAYEQSYTEAVQKSNDALNEYTKAEQNHKKISDDLTTAKANLAQAQKMYDDATDPRTKSQYKAHLESVQRTVDDLTKKEKEASKTVKEKQDTYLGYVTTIQNYEGVTSAIIEGDSAKINDALNLLINDFITAENGTKESLEKQVQNAKTNLENLKTALANGSPGVTQEMVNTAQDMVTKAEAELNKLPGKGKKAGTDTGKATADGLSSKDGDVQKSAQKTTNIIGTRLDGAKAKGLIAGQKAGQATADGLKFKQSEVQKRADELTNTAGKELDKGKTKGKTAGEKTGQANADGIKSKQSTVKNSAKSVADTSGKELDKAKTQAKKAGQNATTENAKGMTSKKATVKTAGTTVAKEGKKGLDGVKTGGSGENFTKGFGRGILNQNAQSVVKTNIGSLASKALTWLRNAIGEASPAKKPMESGRNYTRGFAVGVVDAMDEAEDSIEKLADDSLETLNDNIKNNVSDIRKSVSSMTGAIVEETKDKAEAFDNQLKKLDTLFDFGVYDEKKYYNELTYLRDTYLTTHSDKWLDVTKKIYNYQKDSLENQKKIYDEQKKKVEEFADYARDKIDKVNDLQDSFSEKLIEYGELFHNTQIIAGDEVINFKSLANIEEQNNALRNYADLLTQIKNRENVPYEFFETLRDMSVEEGTSFATALLDASDADFNKFIEQWTEKQRLASEISGTLYQREAQDVADEITAKFGELEDDFVEVGENSAEQFETGFLESLGSIMANIRKSINESFADILSDLSDATVNINTNDSPTDLIDTPVVETTTPDGIKQYIPIETNGNWINDIARKVVNNFSPNIVINNDAIVSKLDDVYDRIANLQIVLDSGALVGNTIDKIDAGLADKQALSARGV